MAIESDTIKLLRECSAGIEMGVSSIDEVSDYISDKNFKRLLNECRVEHNKLKEETDKLLKNYHDTAKEPNPMAKGMSWLKTNAMLIVNNSDKTIAGLITDGCNMGIKSLNRYLNQYEAAEEKVKDITKRLINLEERLTVNIRKYL